MADDRAAEALAWFRDKAIPAPRDRGVEAIVTTMAAQGITVSLDQALEVWEAATDVAPHTWLNAFSCIRPTDEFAADVGRTVIQAVMSAPNRNTVLRVNAS